MIPAPTIPCHLILTEKMPQITIPPPRRSACSRNSKDCGRFSKYIAATPVAMIASPQRNIENRMAEGTRSHRDKQEIYRAAAPGCHYLASIVSEGFLPSDVPSGGIPGFLIPIPDEAFFYNNNTNQALPMNIAKLMKQAQQMQAGLAAKQEELATQTVEAIVGGGKVQVVANCAGDVLSIKIDPSVIDPEDAEFLEDLILKGVQEAISKGKEKSAAEMQKLTGGLGIPGM